MINLNTHKTMLRGRTSKIVPKIFLCVTMLLLGFAFTMNAQTTYYSKAAATDFNDVTSWGTATNGTGTAPGSLSGADHFVIQNGSIMDLTANATVRSLTINAGRLNVTANTLTCEIPTQNNSENKVTNGGTLSVTGGTVIINGSLLFADGSSLIQTAGLIKIDPNSGSTTTSIGHLGLTSNYPAFGIGYSTGTTTSTISTLANAAKFQVTGGTIQVVDPCPNSGSSNTIAFHSAFLVPVEFGNAHTLLLGDGVSTQAGGSTTGLGMYLYVSSGMGKVGNVVCNMGTGTNRHVTANLSFRCGGNLTINSGDFRHSSTFYLSGNLINNATFTSLSTLHFSNIDLISGSMTINPVTTAQTVSGVGLFRNLAASATANYSSITINNTSAGGVTLSTAEAINATGAYTGTASGTVKFTNGVLNCNSTYPFIIGTSSTSLGFVSGGALSGFAPGTTVGRWYAAAGDGATITANANSTSTLGLYPFVSGNPVSGITSRNFYRGTGTLSTAGTVRVTYNDGAGLTALTPTFTETQTYDMQTNANWVVATGNGAVLSGPAVRYEARGEGAFPNFTGNVRLIRNGVNVNKHFGANSTPMAQRDSLTAANQVGTFRLAAVASENPIVSATSGKWEDGSTWVGGVVPSCSDRVSILTGHTVTVDATTGTANSASILAQAGSQLAISAGTLNVGCTLNNNTYINNGFLNMTGGDININGNLAMNNGSKFTQTAGTITIDGNNGGNPVGSVASGTPIFSLGVSGNSMVGGTNVNVTGGTIVIVDPHTATTNTNGYAFYGNVASGQGTNWGDITATPSVHTIKFGNGSSTDSCGNASGFYINQFVGSGIAVFGNMEVNNPSGIKRIVTCASTTSVNGDLNVVAGEMTNGTAALNIGKNLTVGGILTATGTVNFGRVNGSTTTTNMVNQIVSVTGAGIIRNLAVSPTANFTGISINDTSATGVTFNTLNAVGIQPANSASMSGTLTFTAGRLSTASGTAFIHGVPGVAAPTLTVTAGGVMSGSTFARSFTAATTGSAITEGADPTTTTSRFPFVTSTFVGRSAWIQRNTPTGAGVLAMTYTENPGTSSTFQTDASGYVVDVQGNDTWSVSTLGTTPTATSYNLAIVAPGLLGGILSADSTRIFQSAGFVGTHRRGTVTPGGQRNLTLAELTSGDFYLGANANEIPNMSIVSGVWDDPGTWSKNAVPTCVDNAIISAGHTVTVSTTGNVCNNVTINTGATLLQTGGDLTVGCTANKSQFLINAGTYNISAGTLNVNGKFINNGVNGSLIQSGGDIIVDANDNGNVATSAAGHIVDMYALDGTKFQLTGGTFTVVDPAVSTATGDHSFKIYPSNAFTTGPGWTLKFGNGISNQPGGHTGGFLFQTLGPTANTIMVIGGTVLVATRPGASSAAVNRHVQTLGAIGIKDLLIATGDYRTTSTTYISGNLTNNDTLTSGTSSIYMGAYNGTASVPSTIAQSIGGTGIYRDNSINASVASNIYALYINNSNASGVTMNVPLQIRFLYFVNGLLNTSSTNMLTSGTTASIGTIATSGGTFSNTTHINGPVRRIYPNRTTTTGSFSTSTHYPVGENGVYLPIWVDPTVTGTFMTQEVSAYNSFAGTAGVGVSNLSNKHWETSIITNPANYAGAFVQVGDTAATMSANTKLLQSATPTGIYDGTPGGSLATLGTPNVVRANTFIPIATLQNNFAYGDLTVCPTPADQPTAFTVNYKTNTTFTGGFTAASSNPTGYLVVRYPTATTPTTPVAGTLYSAASALGSGTVVGNYYTAPYTFAQTGLTASSKYNYYIYSFNNSGCSGPIYDTVAPLLDSVTMCGASTAAPTSLTWGAHTTNSFTMNWVASTLPGAEYLVEVSPNSSFTSFVSGYNQLNVGTATTVTVSGLSAGTTYWARVRAKDTAVASIACTSSALTANSVATLCTSPVTSFYENFDAVINGTSTTVWPSCWAKVGSNTTSYLTTTNVSAPNSLYLSGNTGATVSMPPVSNGAAGTHKLKFRVYSGTLVSNLKIGYLTTPGDSSTFVTMATYTPSATSVFDSFTVSPVVLPAGVTTMAFKSGTVSASFYIDNVSYEALPICSAAEAGVISTPVTSVCANTSVTISSVGYYKDSLNFSYLWQTATDAAFTTPVDLGTPTLSYSNLVTPGTTVDAYYRLKVSCATNASVDYSNVLGLTVTNAAIATTTPATRCGYGTVVLGATPAGTANLRWYDVPSGGVSIGSGTSFTTPNINSTDTFYVAGTAPKPNTFSTFGTLVGNSTGSNSSPYYHGYGGVKSQYIIKASELTTLGFMSGNFTKIAFDIVSGTTTYGDFTIRMGHTTANTLAANALITTGLSTVYYNAAQTTNVGVNDYTFSTPFNWDGTSNIVYDITYTNNNTSGTSGNVKYTTASYTGSAYISADNVSDVNDLLVASSSTPTIGTASFSAASANRPMTTFTGQGICEGTRVAVIATVTPAPALTISSASSTLCAGSTLAPVTVTTPVSNFNTYVWSPALTATGDTSVVFSPTATTVYTLTATETATGCVNVATHNVTVTDIPNIVTTNSTPSFCLGGNTNVTAVDLTTNNIFISGTGTATMGVTTTAGQGLTPYSQYYEGQRTQYLITAAELTAAGILAGNMSSLAFDVATKNSSAPYLAYTIKMANTSATSLASADATGTFTTVYGPTSYTTTLGLNQHNFATPFVWNGTSNIVVQVCYELDPTSLATMFTNNDVVNATSTGSNVYTRGYYQDNAATCSNGLGTLVTKTERPNMRIAASGTTFVWNPGALSGSAKTLSPTVSTVYTVTATGFTGCTKTSTVNVTVKQPTSSYDTVSAVGSYVWSANGTTYSTLGTNDYTHTLTNAAGCDSLLNLHLTLTPNSATLNVIAYIQGYYIGSNTMNPVLMNQLVPGATSSQCDTITVSLHDATTYALVESYTGVIDTAGQIACTFAGSTIGNSYYVVLTHRNAVETWSAAPVAITSSTSYNFSTASTQAYGGNMIDVLSDGVYSIYSGDLSGAKDGFVTGDDGLLIETDIDLFSEGYFDTDLNGDGFVTGDDLLFFDINLENFIESSHP